MRDALAEVKKSKRYKYYSFKARIRIRLAVWLYKLADKLSNN